MFKKFFCLLWLLIPFHLSAGLTSDERLAIRDFMEVVPKPPADSFVLNYKFIHTWGEILYHLMHKKLVLILHEKEQLSDGEKNAILDKLHSLSFVESVHLEGFSLNWVPDEIKGFKRLRCLNLRGNDLTTLPPWLYQLQELQELDISYNQLKKLPQTIGKIKKLRSLHLDFNALSKLPSSFSRLKKLMRLELGWNNFSQFPEEISRLTQLQEVNMSYNGFGAVPALLEQLKAIQRIYFNGCNGIPLKGDKQFWGRQELHAHFKDHLYMYDVIERLDPLKMRWRSLFD